MDQRVTTPDLMDRLGRTYEQLSASERRVADFVLADPQRIPRMNLASIADGSGVSEPTVLRFCRAVGLDGYAHFKIALAASLASGGAAYVHRDIGFEDDVSEVRTKLIQSSVKSLTSLGESLDDATLSAAVERLCDARRVQLFAVGLAGVLATDAQAKLMRLDIICEAQRDAHLQTMAAATLGPGDVGLALSYNGQIKDVVRSARTAKDAGAFVIGVTRSGSALARVVDLLIPVDPPEDTFLYAPMTSRLAHLVVIDLITTLVALSRGPGIVPHLEHIKESLSDQWIAEGSRTKRRSQSADTQSKPANGGNDD